MRQAAGWAAPGLLMLCVACGGPATGAAEPTVSFLPSADAFTSAVVSTKALGTARLSVQVERQGSSLTATGPVVLSSGLGDLTWSSEGRTWRELSNERGIYRQDASGAWTQLPAGAPSSTSGFAGPLRGLSVLRDVTDEGPDTLDGVGTTRYRGWLPLDEAEARQLGLEPDAVAGQRLDVTVWVDGSGHIVRVDRRAPASGAPVISSRSTMDDFSLLLNLNSPSSLTPTGATTPPP